MKSNNHSSFRPLNTDETKRVSGGIYRDAFIPDRYMPAVNPSNGGGWINRSIHHPLHQILR